MTARRMTLTSWHRGWIAIGSSDGGNTVETLWRILPGYDCRTNHLPKMKRIEFETSHNPKRLRVAPKICDHPVIKRGNSIMTLSDRQKLNLKMRSLAKVLFLGVHYIVLQYISISCLHHLVPLAEWMQEYFLHLHFSVCSVFDCLALSFAALELYGMVWYLPMQLQITVAPSFLKLRNKLWIQYVGRSPDELSQHAPGLSLASVCVAKSNHRHGPMIWRSSSSIKIVKPQLSDRWQLNQRKLERRPVVIVTACMKARKYKNAHPEGFSDGETKWISKSMTTKQYVIGTKPFAIIRNKEIGQDQECQHTFAHLPLCELGVTYTVYLYPTTESLDDLDASRKGIHNHVMNATPWHPTMLSHMNWFPCYRFWESTISFYSISCLHHLVPLAEWMQEYFLHLHFSVCSVFDCLALSFAALELYGMVWYLPMQLQITVAPSFLKLRNKLWIQYVGRSPDELSQHAPGLSLAGVCVAKSNHRHGPMIWRSSSSIKIVKPQLSDRWQLNQRKLERRPVVIVTACMKARKYKNAHPEGFSDGETKWVSKSMTTKQYVIGTKPFAIIRNKEIGQDQECQHTFAHLPLCELGVTYTVYLYPTTESLDDLDASRTGIHNHVMNATPWHPTMLSHMNWFPCYRFWESTISFYSISCLHHLVPLAEWMQEYFLHLHFSVCSVFDCLALSFAALELYGMV